MGLKLQEVPAAAGMRWVRAAFGEYFSHPMAYAGMLVSYLLLNFGVVALFSLLANITEVFLIAGAAVLVMMLPLLTLAFMMGTRDSLQGRILAPAVFLMPWTTLEPDRRRPLLVLMAAFAAATFASLLVVGMVHAEAIDQIKAFMAAGQRGSDEELMRLLESPAVMSLRAWSSLAVGAVSLPFWFAPALVYWGGQGPAQAMFSSLLAIWRAKGAFLTYGLGFMAVLLATSVLVGMALAVLGATLAALLAMMLGLMVPAAFYVSLYFSFRDCFGEP
jgi:hypothetical protein